MTRIASSSPSPVAASFGATEPAAAGAPQAEPVEQYEPSVAAPGDGFVDAEKTTKPTGAQRPKLVTDNQPTGTFAEQILEPAADTLRVALSTAVGTQEALRKVLWLVDRKLAELVKERGLTFTKGSRTQIGAVDEWKTLWAKSWPGAKFEVRKDGQTTSIEFPAKGWRPRQQVPVTHVQGDVQTFTLKAADRDALHVNIEEWVTTDVASGKQQSGSWLVIRPAYEEHPEAELVAALAKALAKLL